MDDPIRSLALRDGRYGPEAFRFLFESLEAAIHLAGKENAQGTDRHVTGGEVLEGMKAHALELFGPLSGDVWRSWGVRESLDWGRIVFLLCDAKLLNRQETDTVEDFRISMDFDQAFISGYRPSIPTDPTELGSGDPSGA